MAAAEPFRAPEDHKNLELDSDFEEEMLTGSSRLLSFNNIKYYLSFDLQVSLEHHRLNTEMVCVFTRRQQLQQLSLFLVKLPPRLLAPHTHLK